VCAANTRVLDIQPVLKDNLQKIKGITETLHSRLDCVIKSVTNKKNECKNIIRNKALTEFALWIMKLPYKRIISVLEIILTIRKILKPGFIK